MESKDISEQYFIFHLGKVYEHACFQQDVHWVKWGIVVGK